MADPLGTFQSQLSRVMETVFKAAMYEITRLVEDSFMEEVTRCREQVESLKRRLKWSESRRKEVRDEDELRLADYERLEMFNEEEPKALQSDLTLKQENGLQEHMNSHKGTDEQTSSSEMEAHSGLKASQSSYVQTLDRVLKEETLHLTTEAKESEDLDETECSQLPGPSKHSRFQRFPKSHCKAGLDQRLQSTHNVDSGDQSEPLLQNRHVTKDSGDFKKTDYGVTSMMYNLDELHGSSSQLSNDLTYMSHYEGNTETLEEAKDQTFQTVEPRLNKGTAGSDAGSPTRTNTDLIEFSCLLINEEGYILNQNQSLVSPAHASSDSGGRLSFQDQGIHIDKSLDSPADMYEPSNVYHACDTTHLSGRLQVQTAGKGSRRHICNQCSLYLS
ncbi:uncharacterized protein LOC133403776 [Phycodurus eques]|uniref:uncharacterized protein LOC133403776 n=1 Tax=Phycodurus eques TaxID=693459 RepID=UPI002ACE359C|nr:uncharacterized protein LOC133403776 [Phycodurus eques]XP_061534992.1 uncharacterized protein LOC133403776 [Phycodurus eques]XP_061534993.1 uncharacterized protein LOC133403776 [Phycodurus eques]